MCLGGIKTQQNESVSRQYKRQLECVEGIFSWNKPSYTNTNTNLNPHYHHTILIRFLPVAHSNDFATLFPKGEYPLSQKDSQPTQPNQSTLWTFTGKFFAMIITLWTITERLYKMIFIEKKAEIAYFISL